MGFMDKFRNIMGAPDEEYDDDYEDTPEDLDEFVTKPEEPHRETVTEAKRGNKVVNIHATAQLQVVLVKPERFDDASSIADHLNSKRTVCSTWKPPIRRSPAA